MTSYKVPYNKPPITLSAQVKQFQDRGLLIDNVQVAEHWLAQLNYYRFAGYCLNYEQDHETHRFVAGAKFEEVLSLYFFDRKLRLLLLDAIERFEVALRTQFSYHLSHAYNNAHPHLVSEIFFNRELYFDSKEKLKTEVERSSEDFIRHLTSKYHEELPPVWAVVELITMGQLSKWYRNIKKRSDRQQIAHFFKVDERILVSFCQHLSVLRNFCAHHARIWNRDFVFTFKLPGRCEDSLKYGLWFLPDSDRKLRKIYNTLTMLNYFMKLLGDKGDWAGKVMHLIEKHNIDVSKMGFPANWRERAIWILEGK